MSKFCGIISRGNEENEDQPLLFSDLEMLANLLGNEQSCAENEFLQKCQFVFDREKTIWQNATTVNDRAVNQYLLNSSLIPLQLFDVDKRISRLNEATKELEEDLENDRKDFQIIEKAICSAENNCNYSFDSKAVPFERIAMLNQLKNFDAITATLAPLIEDVAECMRIMPNTAQNSLNQITGILDCHQCTLEAVEGRLKVLEKNVGTVYDALVEAMGSLNKTKNECSSSKCI